jgi:hypothetical protein
MFVTVCEFASINADGTFTVVRGGLLRWWADRLPWRLHGHVYAEVPAESLVAGTHPVTLSATGEQLAVQLAAGDVVVKAPAYVTRLSLPIDVLVPTYGRTTLRLAVGLLSAHLTVECEPLAKE